MEDKITLISTDPNAIIRYTTDGSIPNESSLVYSEPVFITGISVLKARGYSESGEASEVSEIRFGSLP